MNWFSQFGQDRWVAERILPGHRNGFFVDIGAYDGVTISNTFALEKTLGWSGICVEANTENYQRLTAARNCHCVNVCLLDRVTEVDYVEAAGTEDWHPAMSGIPEMIRASKGELPVGCDGRLVTKQTDTLANLLGRLNAPPTIDYLSIDTEGSEYTILKDFPFDKYVFAAITIEHNSRPLLKRLQRRLLRANGYVLLQSDIADDYWVHKTHPRLVSLWLFHTAQNIVQWLRGLPHRIRDRVRLRSRIRSWWSDSFG